MKVMPKSWAVRHGFSADKRRRRRQHRRAAAHLRANNVRGGALFEHVARWHLHQARFLK